jgi:thiol-disulfide isomerase/thioredoxin
MNFLKKNWRNILFLAAIVLLLVPQTAMPIKVFFNRLVALSPSEVVEEERVALKDYQWNLTTLHGEGLNFSRSEGKVILVNLWATWCPPCVAEMPSMQKLHDTYGSRVDFYFVTSEANEKPYGFITKNEYNFPVYIELQVAPAALRSRSIPATYIISKNGTIVIDQKGAANWNSKKVHEVLDALLLE